MYRYIAAFWNDENPEACRTASSLRTALASSCDLATVYRDKGAIVADTGERGPMKAIPLRDFGVILGALFDVSRLNEAPCRGNCVSASAITQIIESRGKHLLKNFWGSYISIVRDDATGDHSLLLSPGANLPCFHCIHGSVRLFFSNVEDCTTFLDIPFAPDRQYLGRWLILGRHIAHDCGLQGVSNLYGGERVVITGSAVRSELLWDPPAFAHSHRMETVNDAADRLRSTAQGVINTWARQYDYIAHKLSGGLDSSIVAGCLARAPTRPETTLLHITVGEGLSNEDLYLPGVDARLAEKVRSYVGSGDERYFARQVATKWGMPLVEKSREVSIDLRRMWQAPLSLSPSSYFASWEIDDAEIEFSRAHGTQAFFSGLAGDSLFFATHQPIASIDHAYTNGIDRNLPRYILESAKLSRDSVWSVAWQTLRCGIMRFAYRSPFSVLQVPTLVHDDIVAGLSADDFVGPWAERAKSLPPGKRQHVNGVHGSSYPDCVFYSGQFSDHIDPLNSQPLWELLLSLPLHTVLSGGVSRGLARIAFAEQLPPEIRYRDVKGSGSQYYQHVVRQNRRFLQNRLLDGALVREGYLNRIKLERALKSEQPFMGISALSLLSYLSAEAWFDAWSNRPSAVSCDSVALSTSSCD